VASAGNRTTAEKEYARAKLSPVVVVPGITSSVLEARISSTAGAKDPWCGLTVPEDEWFVFHVSEKQVANLACWLWLMQLEPPGPDGCVRDVEGKEVREVGFGGTQGAVVINPADILPFKLFEKMVQMLEGLGHMRDRTVRFATYDWRKYGDACWERAWFPRLQRLLEETAADAGRKVTLACHSMGCPLAHLFLNTVDAAWKQRFIQEFLAMGPAFAGGAEVVKNFVSGPSYGMAPFIASQMGRASLVSLPGFMTLLPNAGMDAWPEDLVFVETPWKNYTIASLYDGSLLEDVEEPGESPQAALLQELDEAMARRDASGSSLLAHDSASTTSAPASVQAPEDLDQVVLTQHGCVCAGHCSHTGEDLLGWMAKLPHPFRASSRQPWCDTKGHCGYERTLSKTRWDWCGPAYKPEDAGPGFVFYAGVHSPPDTLSEKIFGVGHDYKSLGGLQVEELKAACLADSQCTAFDTLGTLKKGAQTPGSAWVGTQRAHHGVLLGTFVKRPEVCGSDGQTYASPCLLANAQCWKPGLEQRHEGPCEDAYRTPQGCACASQCGRSSKLLPALYSVNAQRWCRTKDGCGYSVRGMLHWDYCGDHGGLDTGRGFEYFPSTSVPEGSLLRKGEQPFSLDALQRECGADADCGGFASTGELFTHAFSGRPESWTVPREPKHGVYRKLKSVAECQRKCDGTPKVVCVRETHTTYRSDCDAQNARCLPGAGPMTAVPGPCRRQSRTALHDFARRHLERKRDLGPPGVPTTCLYITDVPTELSYRYDPDFQQPAETIASSGGDGTVNTASAEGPCRQWQRAQAPVPVQVLPLELGGTSHVSMLFDDAFLRHMKLVVTSEWVQLQNSSA